MIGLSGAGCTTVWSYCEILTLGRTEKKLVGPCIAIATGVFAYSFTPFDKGLLVPVSSLLRIAISPR